MRWVLQVLRVQLAEAAKRSGSELSTICSPGLAPFEKPLKLLNRSTALTR
jgi:hypothetical protein